MFDGFRNVSDENSNGNRNAHRDNVHAQASRQESPTLLTPQFFVSIRQ
jgi:hypothetical protein